MSPDATDREFPNHETQHMATRLVPELQVCTYCFCVEEFLDREWVIAAILLVAVR